MGPWNAARYVKLHGEITEKRAKGCHKFYREGSLIQAISMLVAGLAPCFMQM